MVGGFGHHVTFSNDVDVLGHETVCNGLTVLGGATFCNGTTYVSDLVVGALEFPGLSNLVADVLRALGGGGCCGADGAWDALSNEPLLDEFLGSLVVESNLYVGGRIVTRCNAGCCPWETAPSCVSEFRTSEISWVSACSESNPFWTQRIDVHACNVSADMVFQSRNGAFVSFTDEFVPSVLNFTGKHRCVFADAGPERWIGAVVVATGLYRNLDDTTVPGIDESIPVVALSTSPSQKSVFGVISAVDNDGVFSVGNLRFSVALPGRRVVVNAAGEGGILVCDENGPIETGDLLVTSSTPGHSMRQADDVVRACTIAKATCACRFENTTSALIGCVYV